MSLFNDLARTALGALSGNSQGGSPIQQIIGELITNNGSGNGLTGLLQQLTKGGLGAQASSWVSTGENQPVTGDQLRQALGSDQISALAQKVGIAPEQISGALAQYLPQVIDRLTPRGEVPAAGGIASALGSLLQSDLFRGLTGSR
jgi:uncharacterized protein YidB (DUF937 family)